MKTVFKGIRITRSYLVVEFTIKGQLVGHRHCVRIPWRALNVKYRDLVNALEDEAQAELRRQSQPPLLPLEVWE